MSFEQPTSVSLRPHDITEVAERLLHGLPALRDRLGEALAASRLAAAASSPAAARALHDSGLAVQRAVNCLDTSVTRLASALQVATADLIAQDAAMWGRATVTAAAPATPGSGP